MNITSSHLINSEELSIKYYGYYFAFKDFQEKGDKEEAKKQIEEMKKLENFIPKVIVKSCMVSEEDYM